jgi:hypothetical protein
MVCPKLRQNRPHVKKIISTDHSICSKYAFADLGHINLRWTNFPNPIAVAVDVEYAITSKCKGDYLVTKAYSWGRISREFCRKTKLTYDLHGWLLFRKSLHIGQQVLDPFHVFVCACSWQNVAKIT